MFDTEKIRRITTLLEKLPEEFDDVYLIPEKTFLQETANLFRRLKIPIRAIMHDTLVEKEAWGISVVKTTEVVENFNERTALILLVEKPVPLVQTTFDFRKRGGVWTVPALVIATDEVPAIYDRITLMRTLQQYREDSVFVQPKDLAMRFARGLTTFLDSRYQNVKYQFFDSREYFKPRYDFDDTAIVIQGPIAYDNNYTAETFKLYRSIYPNVPIVVSTWQGEATDAFRKECKENSVVLLENEPPNFRGPWNVNMQLESSFQGVKYVKENTSAKFVLKTRTDQRINQFDFLEHFKNLIKTFPPNCDRLKGRILLLDASKKLPFRTADFLAFGYVADIFRFYDIPRHAGENDELSYRTNHPWRHELILRIANLCNVQDYIPKGHEKNFRKFNRITSRVAEVESYILRKFYTKYIGTIDRNRIIELSWKFIRDCLVIVSIRDISLDWPKYENSTTYDVNGATYSGKMDFSQWLDMYRNFKIDWV